MIRIVLWRLWLALVGVALTLAQNTTQQNDPSTIPTTTQTYAPSRHGDIPWGNIGIILGFGSLAFTLLMLTIGVIVHIIRKRRRENQSGTYLAMK